MSGFGIQLFDSSGTQLLDSTTAVGGVVADHRVLVATDTGTFTYPAFAGYTAYLVNPPDDGTIALDTSLGYPRVTVIASGAPSRELQLWCY